VDRKQIHGVMMIVFKRMMTFMGSSHKEEKERLDLETGMGAVGTGETGKDLKGGIRRSLPRVRQMKLNHNRLWWHHLRSKKKPGIDREHSNFVDSETLITEWLYEFAGTVCSLSTEYCIL
jgi:hypothetical protein